jgi:hypothetical protein
MRENLKAAAWTEFSTLSWAVLQQGRVKCVNTHTDTSRVETLDQVLSCWQKFLSQRQKNSFALVMKAVKFLSMLCIKIVSCFSGQTHKSSNSWI